MTSQILNIRELNLRIEYLEKLINAIQSMVQHNLQLFIALLGIIIAVLSFAGWESIKVFVTKKFDNFYEKNKTEITKDIMKDLNKSDDWIIPTLVNSAVSHKNFTASYKKTHGNLVIFRGRVFVPIVTGPIFSLPNGYRPIRDILIPVVTTDIDGNNSKIVTINIFQNGSVIPQERDVSGRLLHLENIILHID